MKRLLFLMLSLLALTARAQVSPDSIEFNEKGEFSIVVPTIADARQTFLYSKAFFVARNQTHKTKIVTSDSVSYKLQVSGTIAGDNLTVSMPSGKIQYRNTVENFLLSITAKDQRFRVKIESPTYDFDQYDQYGLTKISHETARAFTFHIGFAEEMGGQVGITKTVNKNRAVRYAELINEMLEYIKTQIEDDDF